MFSAVFCCCEGPELPKVGFNSRQLIVLMISERQDPKKKIKTDLMKPVKNMAELDFTSVPKEKSKK